MLDEPRHKTQNNFSKSSANIPPHTSQSTKTSTNSCESSICRKKSIWSIWSGGQSESSPMAQKSWSTDEYPAQKVLLVFRSPTCRGHVDAIWPSIQEVTANSTQKTVLPATEICFGKVPASISGTSHPDEV